MEKYDGRYSQTYISGEDQNDNFGTSISLSQNGSRLAIGTHLNDGGGTNAGHAKIYMIGMEVHGFKSA